MIIIHRELRLHATLGEPSGRPSLIIRFAPDGRTAVLDGTRIRHRLNRLHATLRLIQRTHRLLPTPETRVDMSNVCVWLSWDSTRTPIDESVILTTRVYDRGIRIMDDTRLDVAWVAVNLFSSWLSVWWSGLTGLELADHM